MHGSMRATVTIADDLFAEADRVASTLGISRSRLFQNALAAYLQRLAEGALSEQMNAAIERVGRPDDAALQRYVARVWRDTMGDDEW
jgi:metal-responsive CopG/Arc/MetJ family transcriptional regulator